ncbi:MAG TPA: hypothetical protein VD788_11315 [Candidatus Polarisedimenticolaceae bacterium]|nr:hypothetical protein [Candidatus Polarisedimenticolaceae bacterium]
MSEGINTEVRHGSRVFHVQTQTADRREPVIETLIYEGGAVAVRMTASLAALSEKWRVPAGDVSRLLALQHWEMVHKIKHGMLDGAAAERPSDAPAPARSDPAAVERLDASIDRDAPGVRELLAELEAKLDRLVTGGDPSEPDED